MGESNKAVKIQIGSFSGKRKLNDAHSFSDHPTSSTSNTNGLASQIQYNPLIGNANLTALNEPVSGCKLFDLCDSFFVSRHKKTGRKAKSSVVANNAPSSAKKAVNNANAALSSSSNISGPQVEIVDGKIVLRDSSLVVNNNNSAGGNADYFEEIEENVNACATYASFSRRQSSSMWGIEETRLFYQILRQCGTEFSMMQTFFPKRTRKQLKLKFYREEKLHPELVHLALATKLPLDMEVFDSQLTGNTSGINNNPNPTSDMLKTNPVPNTALLSNTIIHPSHSKYLGEDGDIVAV